MYPKRVPLRVLGFEGPCTQVGYTLAPKYLYRGTTLGPKYILISIRVHGPFERLHRRMLLSCWKLAAWKDQVPIGGVIKSLRRYPHSSRDPEALKP